jgi:hypothetical protein
LFLAGASGVLKTAMARLAQAHWGPAWASRDPANWTWTANALERQTFLTKDALLLIDDFVPGDDPRRRLHIEADRIFRGAANRAGRGRMTADINMRPEYYPRGMIIATGEDLPSGLSLNARIEVVHMRQGDIDAKRLSVAQAIAAAGTLAAAMAGYVGWIAECDKASFRSRLDELRAYARKTVTGHRRTPDNAADLMLGIESFLDFALAIGAVDDSELEHHRTVAWSALLQGTVEQAQVLHDQNPADNFVEMLAAAIHSGRAHLDQILIDGRPVGFNARLAGWRRHEQSNYNDETSVDWAPPPGSRQVGWLDENHMLLDPASAYAAAQQMARESSMALPLRPNMLWRRLKEAKLLAVFDVVRQRNTIRKRINGQDVAVLCLDRSLLGASDT